MALQPGTPAPDFELFNTDKNQLKLSSLRGKKLILHFFPQAFTGVCTTQLCTMRDNLEYYTALNAVVLGISVDSIFTLAEFKKQQNYNFDLLSDFNKEVIKAYDVYHENFAFGMIGVAKRAAFVINEDGLIIHSEETPNPGVLPDFEAIKKAVNS
jgi:peroxiredoxin